MEQNTNEAVLETKGGKRLAAGSGKRKPGGRRPLVVVGIVLAVAAVLLAAAYLGICAYAGSLDTFYPNCAINGVNVAGLTVQDAQEKLARETPEREIPLYDAAYPMYTEADPRDELMSVTLAELGFSPEAVTSDNCVAAFDNWARYCMDSQQADGFFEKGRMYLRALTGSNKGYYLGYELSGKAFDRAVDAVADQLSQGPVDAGYTLGEDTISITKARDGRSVDKNALRQELKGAGSMPYGAEPNWGADISFSVISAKAMTAREIYDEVSGEMKNAGYDAAADTIIPEQVGAEFDVDEAQKLLDSAEPGETVELDAVIERPAVTAEQLKAVLFRDVLGECQTKVGGTSARKANVKLSASSINSFVMNTGDVFSYNEIVGKRTAERGYQAAPAYVKGETVDEIGGGICQTSSTLYLACLRSNLEITERYAHRYVPAYITPGMDATVSWGGPDYKFTNNTDYPIKIVTTYSGGYLTVKILGTKTDDITVKMTNEHLSTTPFEVVYEDDPTLAPGTEKVKTTPYTGHKYKTYRNLYDGSGKLISSTYEATSDYKARNKVILKGPALPVTDPAAPAGGGADIPAAPGTETPAEPSTPPAETTTPEEETPPILVVPEEPAA